MKKRMLLVLLSALLILPLYSCGSPSPTDVAEEFLTAVKAGDTKTLSTIYDGDNMEIKDTLKKQDINLSKMDKQLQENTVEKLQGFEYELSNEKIDGSSATVDVKIKTYDFGDAFTTFFQDYLSQGLSKAFGGASEEEMNELATDIFSTKLEEMKFDYEKTVTLKLIKEDNTWLVEEVKKNSDFLYALTGGLVTAAEEMADSFGEAFSE